MAEPAPTATASGVPLSAPTTRSSVDVAHHASERAAVDFAAERALDRRRERRLLSAQIGVLLFLALLFILRHFALP